ncbi:MAG: NADH-quinone oxidoreductase subunit L, partial [Rhizobium sp.]
QMFFGWEGVGLASYLLIGFWYKKPSASAAAIKAFIVNRVGDFGFVLGIATVFVLFGSINFDTIFANASTFAPAEGGGEAGEVILNLFGMHLDKAHALTGACLLLFMGAMGKSAQFLLHTWLPDAMEGPTPVSALIHAATMVTAGVFLVARMSPLFELSPDALVVVTIIGAITAFFAATVGLVQNDIKRVIAYSTCSQLGYMFVALGVGAYGAAIFHLFTHAFFKALLFLCAGSVIHAVDGEQDMRHMGGLYPHIKVTGGLMIIGTLAITGVGIPFTPIGFAGFFSKDVIIEATYASHSPAAGFAFTLLVIAALFTSFYSWRLIFMTFFGRPRASHEVMHHVHESPQVMLVPLYILAIGAVVAGVLFEGRFYGEEYAEFWKGALFTGAENELVEEFHHVPAWVGLSPFIAMLLGFVTAWYMYIRSPSTPRKLAEQHRVLYQFLLNKWYFDELYDFLFVRSAKALGNFLWKKGDVGVIDTYGPNGIAARVVNVTDRVVRLQTGYLYHYAFAMLIGVAALVTWMMLGSSF